MGGSRCESGSRASPVPVSLCRAPFSFLTLLFPPALALSRQRQPQVFLEQLEGELESENPWERVVSLVDTQTEVVEDFQDTGRMTSILIQLKNEPLDTASTEAAS